MTQELIYTSAPNGLKTGSRGFCTVAATAGMPPRMVTLLESLSGYRHTHAPSATPSPQNPVVYSYLKLDSGESLLSRIGDAGLDYSGRTNKIAHHLVLRDDELTGEGPAAAMMAAGNLLASWTAEPRILQPRVLNPGDVPSGPCHHWKQVTGDAGWAAVLANLAGKRTDCYIIFDPTIDCLPLIAESLSLLPPQKRWEVTFSTFFTGLPPGMKCQWRCVLKDSPEHRAVPPHDRVVRIDLTGSLGQPSPSDLVPIARTGFRPVETLPTAAPATSKQLLSLASTDASDNLASSLAFDDSVESLGSLSEPITHQQPHASLTTPPTIRKKAGQSNLIYTLVVLNGLLAIVAIVLIALWFSSQPNEGETTFRQNVVQMGPLPSENLSSEELSSAAGGDKAQDEVTDSNAESAVDASVSVKVDPEERGAMSEPDRTSAEMVPEVKPAGLPDQIVIANQNVVRNADPPPAPSSGVVVDRSPLPTRPVTLTFLLSSKQWNSYRNRRSDWKEDQTQRRVDLGLTSINSATVIEFDPHSQSFAIVDAIQFNSDRQELFEPSRDALGQPTTVARFGNGGVMLLPNYAKKLDSRFILVRGGNETKLLTLRGAANQDAERSREIILPQMSEQEVDLGNINPTLLEMARVDVDAKGGLWKRSRINAREVRLRIAVEQQGKTAQAGIAVELLTEDPPMLRLKSVYKASNDSEIAQQELAKTFKTPIVIEVVLESEFEDDLLLVLLARFQVRVTSNTIAADPSED